MKAISDRFPARFLTAAGFKGRQSLTIKSASEEQFPDGDRLVIWFEEIEQGCVIRRRDLAWRLATAFGDDPADWSGNKVTLVRETLRNRTPSIGVMVDGRFREERRPPTAGEVAQAAPRTASWSRCTPGVATS